MGCGYKPSTTYQKNIIGNKIKAVVDIDVKSPEENVFLKDALNEAIYTLFDSDISNTNANTTINLTVLSSSLSPLDYDENGYPILYRSYVTLKAEILDKNNKKRIYNVNGFYDFAISANSVINDQIKLNAFKRAAINALNKLIAMITKDGMNEFK
jgi:hypothetical protein